MREKDQTILERQLDTSLCVPVEIISETWYTGLMKGMELMVLREDHGTPEVHLQEAPLTFAENS